MYGARKLDDTGKSFKRQLICFSRALKYVPLDQAIFIENDINRNQFHGKNHYILHRNLHAVKHCLKIVLSIN